MKKITFLLGMVFVLVNSIYAQTTVKNHEYPLTLGNTTYVGINCVILGYDPAKVALLGTSAPALAGGIVFNVTVSSAAGETLVNLFKVKTDPSKPATASFDFKPTTQLKVLANATITLTAMNQNEKDLELAGKDFQNSLNEIIKNGSKPLVFKMLLQGAATTGNSFEKVGTFNFVCVN